MWHEARKQERKIRGMLVDYRKRAERRQDFYEKIKADPTQFMQIHSRRCKIHLDPAVAAAGDSPAIMMPWQGMQDNMIDRFDGRAYLDLDKIPMAPKAQKENAVEAELSSEERLCNYERYRILAQNDFLTISEEKYLQQLHLEEQFGIHAQLEMDKPKKKTGTGAAIGYTYEDCIDTAPAAQFSHTIAQVSSSASQPAGQQEDDSDSDLDVDVAIDISKIDTTQAHELNACGRHYGMKSNDFYSFLTRDADEADALKLAREEEQEKIMLSGRKSRRERRAQRERRFAGRTISPPSYAAKEDLVGLAGDDDERADSADSRSPSPENSGKITYITSFGGEDELQPHSKISINFGNTQSTGGAGKLGHSTTTSTTYADKVRENLDKLKKLNHSIRSPTSNSPKKPLAYQRRRSYSRSRSRSRSIDRRGSIRRRRSRSTSVSRSRRRRSPSRSRNRSSRYSRSRSRSPRRSRSRTTRRSRSRSPRRSRYHSSSSSSSSSSSRSPPRRPRRYQSSSSSSTSPASSSSRSTSRSKASPVHSKLYDVDMRKFNGKSKADPPSAISPKKALAEVKVKPEVLPPPAVNAIIMEEPVVPIRRYYGRKRDDQTSSEEDNETDNEEPDDSISDRPGKSSTLPTSQSDQASSSSPAPHPQNAVPSPKASSPFSSKFGKQPTTSTTVDTKTGSKSHTESSATSSSNPRDRLKRKMQILLNKQYKADKLAEIEKSERQVQMQQEREEEMRELALRLRRRQRELRHKYGTPSSSHSEDDSERHSDEDQTARYTNTPTTKQRPSASSSSKNGSTPFASTSGVAKHQSPYRQRSRSRSRSPHNAHRSAYRNTARDRPSRFSDDRSGRGRAGDGHSRSNSRERSDYRRSEYSSESRRNTGSRYAERDGGYQSRPNYRRSGSRERGGRGGGAQSGGRDSDRNRYGGDGNGGSTSRKLVDY